LRLDEDDEDAGINEEEEEMVGGFGVPIAAAMLPKKSSSSPNESNTPLAAKSVLELRKPLNRKWTRSYLLKLSFCFGAAVAAVALDYNDRYLRFVIHLFEPLWNIPVSPRS